MKSYINEFDLLVKKHFYSKENESPTIWDKNAVIRTFLHYSDPIARAGKKLDVFGKAREGLFYNYDDRLCGSKWNEGVEIAKFYAKPSTVRYYEIILNHFHNSADVNIEHVVLGCNQSNGYSYLVFGYTYTELYPRRFKQNSPCDQQMTAIGALEGHISNLEDGTIDTQQFVKNMKPILEDLKELSKFQTINWPKQTFSTPASEP